MNYNDFNLRKYNKKKQMYRFTLGIQQLWNYPLLNLIWVLFVYGVVRLVMVKREYIASMDVYPMLEDVFSVCMTTITIIFPIICAIGIIQLIGFCFAQSDEAKLAKVFGNKQEYQVPILIYKKIDWKSKVIKREFYTDIPLKCWQEKIDTICFDFTMHLIGDITYGGKNKNTGNHIYFESADGMNPEGRGILYDDTF